MIRVEWALQKQKSWRISCFFIKLFYKKASLIISNSEDACRELIDDFGMKPEKCNVIYNAVNVDEIQRLASIIPVDK